MSDKSKYRFPEYIAREWSNDGVVSENDKQIIEDIYLLSENFNYPSSQTDANWLKVKSELTLPTFKPEFKIVKQPVYYTFAKWAVAAVIVISLTFGIIKFGNQPNESLPMAESSANTLKKIILPDGSIVTLNTFSSITTNDFDSDERIITLKGEAYFDVVHNKKPFIVKTESGSVRVTGTKFNIRNRRNTPFQVALSEGKISLRTSIGVYNMSPGEVITENNNHSLILSEINPSTLGWLDEKLVFENETLLNIVSALESQYNVTLVYDSTLNSEKLTLTFNKLTAQQAVELLSKTLNSKVVVK